MPLLAGQRNAVLNQLGRQANAPTADERRPHLEQGSRCRSSLCHPRQRWPPQQRAHWMLSLGIDAFKLGKVCGVRRSLGRQPSQEGVHIRLCCVGWSQACHRRQLAVQCSFGSLCRCGGAEGMDGRWSRRMEARQLQAGRGSRAGRRNSGQWRWQRHGQRGLAAVAHTPACGPAVRPDLRHGL